MRSVTERLDALYEFDREPVSEDSFQSGWKFAALFAGRTDVQTYKLVFDLASLAWFMSAPLWFVPKLFGKEFEQAGRRARLRPKGEE